MKQYLIATSGVVNYNSLEELPLIVAFYVIISMRAGSRKIRKKIDQLQKRSDKFYYHSNWKYYFNFSFYTLFDSRIKNSNCAYTSRNTVLYVQ